MAKTLEKALKTDMSRLPLRKAAEQLRKKGRGRDTILAHITPREAARLKAEGGSGTINPDTGLPEFEDEFFAGPTYDTTPAPMQSETFQPQQAMTPTELRDVASGLQTDYNAQVGNQSVSGVAPGQELWSNYFTAGTPQDYYTAQVASQFPGGAIPQPMAPPDALGAIYAAAPGGTIPANVLALSSPGAQTEVPDEEIQDFGEVDHKEG
jgi:hypothetical protein